MILTTFFGFLLAIPLVTTQTITYDSSQLSSASSAAREADATLIFEFILDFNHRYNEYLSHMAANNMRLPTAIGNYFVGIQTIQEESSLIEYIKTKDFPFSDFETMATQFTWYDSIMSVAEASTFYKPEHFLTDQIKATSQASLSSTTASAPPSASSRSDLASTADPTASNATSSGSGSSSSTISSASTSSSVSIAPLNFTSANAALSDYIPLFSILIVPLFLL